MNRRQFLAAASSAVLLPVLQADSPPPRRMTLALTPGSIGVNVKSQKELNELAQRHRFEAVEPLTAELAALSPERLAEVLADLQSKSLVWAAAGLPVDFRGEESVFRDGLAQLPPLAAGLQRAGVTRVGTWISPSHPDLTYRVNFNQHANRLREVARILDDHGLRLGLEYVGTQLLLVGRKYPFIHTLAETRELISAIGTGQVGLVLDTWHWWTAGDSEADILALKATDVVSVDLNDAPTGREKALQRDNERELPLATGVIEVAPFLQALLRIGYDGPVRPEPFNRALNALDNEAACAAASAALHRAMELIGG